MSQFVVRPGETDFDVQDRIQGALDLPLTACGLAQVEELAESLRAAELDWIYTSPSEPALSTAEMLGRELHVPVRILDGLANSNLGLWQGLSRKEVRQKQPRVFRQWEEAPESVCPPCGEQPEEIVDRVSRALRKPVRRSGSFAVVASDPIAGLVEQILSGGARRQADFEPMPATCRRIGILETAGSSPL